MGKLKKLKEFLQKDIKIFEKINLQKKYPGYFTKNIFRLFILIMFILAGVDFYIGGSFSSFHYSCESEHLMCKNEFYVCNATETQECINEKPPDYVCDIVPCNEKYILAGYYGRTDFIHRYGVLILLSLIPIAFVTNHIYYKLKKGDKN